MGLSNLGIFHTVIGIFALGAALASCLKYGKINLADKSGQLYFFGTIITSLTALGLSKHGGFNAGHIFSLLVLLLVVAAYVLNTKMKENKRARHFENFFLSFSFFLSMIPTVNETLTRIPLGHPFAKDSSDPLIGKILLPVFILFIAGTVYQIVQQRKINKSR
jgi:hypothetical protein